MVASVAISGKAHTHTSIRRDFWRHRFEPEASGPNSNSFELLTVVIDSTSQHLQTWRHPNHHQCDRGMPFALLVGLFVVPNRAEDLSKCIGSPSQSPSGPTDCSSRRSVGLSAILERWDNNSAIDKPEPRLLRDSLSY